MIRSLALSLTTLGTVLTLLAGMPAQALNNKSFVAGTGSDANNCSTIPLACATFAHALSQTAAGGEITVVDTGDYGRVGISQSVNITNDGAGEASILTTASFIAIDIHAGAGDIISVRGLVLDGLGFGGGGGAGIVIESASAVHVQNCVIRNFNGGGAHGIVVDSSTNTRLFVSDTIIFNNGNIGTSGGILIETAGPVSANVVLDRVHLENNVIGLFVTGAAGTGNGAHVVIRDSVVSDNASDGIQAVTVAGKAPAFIVVEHTTVVNNAGTGILANGPRATMLLNDNTITRNGAGISAINSGQLISFGNNRNANNVGAEGAPTGFFSQM